METICKMERLAKRFGNKVVLNDFSLCVNAGEMLCIAGASGSGKSTILNIVGMFESADSGEISLFEQPQPKLNSKKGRALLQSKLFYLFQNYALVDDRDISYNLEIPLMAVKKSKKEKEILKRQALEKVGLSVPLSQKVYQLSGGEQQRVSIARGFLRPFDLLLADEPTGSLDADNRDVVFQLLQQFHAEGKTVIIVSHDPYIIKHCPRTVRIKDGRAAEDE
ncbi:MULTISPECIES: ATP-binding cassette domain-containing protein [Caproicibacterium]|uniref:ATP-binding cassette domain-containing protein n=1 Tax=Caproicibacterium argilliputei TaxID=3030016 RepID=A0AA97DBH1_9FIRM|nr:ATP-binding cassette domain-containing protein [Caproicibacterium argilliputei]WOC32692.1 ATP-binding cassette domain-containing protein [Caproicibacterium argilliputei]